MPKPLLVICLEFWEVSVNVCSKMNPTRKSKKVFRSADLLCVAGTLALVGCAMSEPEDPGYNKPAVSGVVSGEIRSVDDYLSAVQKENERRLNTEGDKWSNPEDF